MFAFNFESLDDLNFYSSYVPVSIRIEYYSVILSFITHKKITIKRQHFTSSNVSSNFLCKQKKKNRFGLCFAAFGHGDKLRLSRTNFGSSRSRLFSKGHSMPYPRHDPKDHPESPQTRRAVAREKKVFGGTGTPVFVRDVP